MPPSVHSQSPEKDEEEDISLPDAPDAPVPSSAENGEGHHSDSDKDMMETEAQPELQSTAEVKEEKRLEDMFKDNSDDEFSDFSASNEKMLEGIDNTPGAPLNVLSTANYSDPEIMYAFYQRLFPFRYLFQWLNHSPSPSTDFAHREFAFTLRNDSYLRYQAFPTADLLRKEILRLNPSRFEIGPVYTTNPRDRKTLRKSTNFRPLSKELVFDIDLTDYDEIRTCCDKANICHKCWSFVTMAIKTVDIALKDDFGFKHVLWVYSGRRGAHAWVCDKRAREMEDSRRKAIIGYLELVKGGSQSGKKVNVRRPLHPHISRSLDILKDHFQEDILENQNPWLEQNKAERLLTLLPDKALADALRKKWDSSPHRSSKNKWADIDNVAKSGVSKSLDAKALRDAKQDIVLEYTYPRLDVEVSKRLNHLLKSPFVVHPGTGRVCVPIDTRRLEDFDPLDIPTVTELLSEIDAWNGDQQKERGGNGEAKKVADYEKTRLKPFVELFRAFVANLMKDEKVIKAKLEKDDIKQESMEF
ncbi:MAG: hypothetical protein M1829_005159 [Trizodia sp. TS-e1964]|nr:MAG: hypothetical protein M1829_005159 [Trizodia sp. TS-e1964]